VEEERTEQEQTEPEEMDDLDVSEEQADDVKGGLGGRERPEDRMGK
jgi:hypothetical protein